MTTDGVAAPGPAGARRRVRNLLLIVGAFVLVLGGIAGGTLFYFYDKATEIDRSTPRVVIEQFLDAALVLRDRDRVALFLCDGYAVEDAIDALDTETGSEVHVSWGDTSVQTNGTAARATVQVFFTVQVGENSIEESQRLGIDLVDRNGWRVCGVVNESLSP